MTTEQIHISEIYYRYLLEELLLGMLGTFWNVKQIPAKRITVGYAGYFLEYQIDTCQKNHCLVCWVLSAPLPSPNTSPTPQEGRNPEIIIQVKKIRNLLKMEDFMWQILKR